jgi:hypothetical protein
MDENDIPARNTPCECPALLVEVQREDQEAFKAGTRDENHQKLLLKSATRVFQHEKYFSSNFNVL